MPSGLTKLISILISFCLILEQTTFAQSLDLSAHFVNFGRSIAQTDKFRPLHLRSISYDSQSQGFKLLLDKGDFIKGLSPQGTVPDEKLQEETQTLFNYFRIGLTLPNDKFWVNLRPDSPDNILDPDLEKTDIGRIFLEADLQLKKDTAQWTSPQTKEGKEYWDKLYKKAGELFGTENITIPTLTRPWIVPNEIIIRESPEGAYIYKATLKVMLEEDYLKSSQLSAVGYQQYSFQDSRIKELNQYSSQLIRETIIPRLTFEVNTSKRYAPLRQVYYSLILAQWFKQRFKGRFSESSSLFGRTVPDIDSRDLTNLTSKEPYDKQTYFRQYQKSFKDGEYNLSEPVYTPLGQSIRRYMSGGIQISSSSSIEKGTIPGSGLGFYLKRPYLILRLVESVSPNNPLKIINPQKEVIASSSLEGNKKDESKHSAFKKLARAYGEFYLPAIRIILESSSDEEKEEKIRQLLEKLSPRYKGLFQEGLVRIKEKISNNKAIIDQSEDKKGLLLTLLMSQGGLSKSETKTFLEKFSKEVKYIEYAGMPFLEMNTASYREIIRLGIVSPTTRGMAFSLSTPSSSFIKFVVLNRDLQNYEATKGHELQHLIWIFMEESGLIKEINLDNLREGFIFREFREELASYLLFSKGDISDIQPEAFLETKDEEILRTFSQVISFLNFSLSVAREKGVPIADFFYAVLRAGDFVELKRNFMEILGVEREQQDAYNKVVYDYTEIIQNFEKGFRAVPLKGLQEQGGGAWESAILAVAKESTNLQELLLFFDISPEHLPLKTAHKLFPFLPETIILELLKSAKDYKFLKIPLHISSLSEFIKTLFKVNWMLKDVITSIRLSEDNVTVLQELPDFFIKIAEAFPRIVDELKQKKDELKDMLRQQPISSQQSLQAMIEHQLVVIDFLSNLKLEENTLLQEGASPNTDARGKSGTSASPALVKTAFSAINNPGGIDFTRLPIVTQAITNLGSSPLGPSAYLSLSQLNLGEERQAIERLASSGITPSPERLKSYLQASCLQDKIGEDKDRALGLLTEVLRDEESSLRSTEAGLRDILVVLESSTSNQQLKEIFLGR